MSRTARAAAFTAGGALAAAALYGTYRLVRWLYSPDLQDDEFQW